MSWVAIVAMLVSLVISMRSGWSGHLEHGAGADLGIARWSAGAQDGVGSGGVVDTVYQQRTVDVDGNHFAQHEPGVHGRTVGPLKSCDLRQSAFEVDRALEHARRRDDRRGHWSQACVGELV